MPEIDAAGATSNPGSPVADSDWYPCDGDTSEYDVVITGGGNSWSIEGGGASQSYTDMASALSAGYGRLSGSAGNKATLLVLGDGTIDASVQLKMPSYMVLNLCGTIDVTGSASGSDRSPLYARDRTDIDIPHARVTGNAQYAMFLRSVSNLRLGQIVLEMNVDNSGLGIRIDNNPNSGGARVSNIQIDHVMVAGTGGHGVELYGADDVRIGRFDGINTGDCGLILNNSSNAEVGVVHCENCAHIGTGYAAFRSANSNGKIGSEWPAGNIHVGEVYARGGGRGIFSVSGSGGLTIDRIDIADTGNNAILLQNAYNTTIAAESGSISNGAVVLSNDTDNTNNGTYEGSSNVTLQNLSLSNGASISEAWCDLGDRGNRAGNITGGTVSMCF
jgi:hypothetical protein